MPPTTRKSEVGKQARIEKQVQKQVELARQEALENPFFEQFKSMESLLGGQMEEIYRQLRAHYATTINLLDHRDSACRDAEMKCKELEAELDALRTVDPHRKEGKNLQIVRSKHQVISAQLVERDRVARKLQAENYELREQLASLQALGAGTLKELQGFAVSLPMSAATHEPTPLESLFSPAPPDTEPTALRPTSAATARSSVVSATASLSGDQLGRVERAMDKLDIWAAQNRPRPDPSIGLVDTSQLPDMQLPASVAKRGSFGPVPPSLENDKAAEDEEEQQFEWNYVRAKSKLENKKPQVLNMKERVRRVFAKVPQSAATNYSRKGICQTIARHPYFEHLTMAVIAVNAIWIGIDLTFNDKELLVQAHPLFIIVENFFLIYFLAEMGIRFGAYRRKCRILKDGWFIFDATLVFAMMLETWVLFAVMTATKSYVAFFDSSVLRMVRLLRLTRMARIARILRALPEVMVLIKGISVAARSVFFTICLLLLLIYIFAIFFTQLLRGTPAGHAFFPTLSSGMFALFFHGCFFDRLPELADALFHEHLLFGYCLVVFLLIGPLTILNMLVGVLVEVVSVVAQAEQEAVHLRMMQEKLLPAMQSLDDNQDETISQREFRALASRKDIMDIFTDLGIDVIALIRDPDVLFAGEDSLPFVEIMDELLAIRGSNPATVKDLTQVKKQILRELGGVTGRRSSLSH